MNQKKARRIRQLSRELGLHHGLIESELRMLAIKPPKGSPARRAGTLWRILYWTGRERLYRTLKRTIPTKWHRAERQPGRRVPATSEWQALARDQIKFREVDIAAHGGPQ